MGSVEPATVNIIDIRRDKTLESLSGMLKRSLVPDDGSLPSLPTLLLYDEKGLRLFEDITYLNDYYLTNAEIETLSKHANEIAAHVPAGTRLIELGSGNLRKVNILLQAFEAAHKSVEYYALDLSLSELKRTFAEIDADKYQYVSLNALHGTYDDGLAWVTKTSHASRCTCIMTLGSSMGNFHRGEAAEFLRGFKSKLKVTDMVLVGLDACEDASRIFRAYNDSEGITEQFYRNGLTHANMLLGYEGFKQAEWSIEGTYDRINHRHQAGYVALNDVKTPDFAFSKGQKVGLEFAYKYTRIESDKLWQESGLIPQKTFGNASGDYHIHLLSPSSIEFPSKPTEYAAHPVPSLAEWEVLWTTWNTVTRSMIPRCELESKPIKLRNNLIFYLGHIPTFADIHITKSTGAKLTDPVDYATIFERGIDPDVDNPERCHDHSEIPGSWPDLEQILDYSERVQSRIVESTKSGTTIQNKGLSQALWLAYEHTAMHLETFLSMLLQSSDVLPPPGVDRPQFEVLAQEALRGREDNGWHEIPASEIKIGRGSSGKEALDGYFGWDNEQPCRTVEVPKFTAQSRCISNGEYVKFLEDTQSGKVPAGWIIQSNDAAGINPIATAAVRTVFGPVPLIFALDWPVMASYDELVAYAKWANGRIPTLEEARSIYLYVEERKRLMVEKVPSKLISAVNGHLSNDGVEETPPSQAHQYKDFNETTSPDTSLGDVFIDLTGQNVAFKTWHPTAVTSEGSRLRGQSDAGGLWEWTSSPLTKHDGFEAMDVYPGYTTDFFDGKHNVVLGGSWATVPRIAGRKSFINWYQRNYPYTWATARLVRDLE